uniref:Cytochrome P450 n=1 Tax=Moniliophthora roreri TaxID=221103 RepID=A0A0W0FAE3_MONRR
MLTPSLLATILIDHSVISQRALIFASALASLYVFAQAAKRFLFPGRPCDDDGNYIPPGPIGLPIVGSFPFLTHYPELTLDYWAKRFGPLYSLWLGNQLFVIVSDPHIVKDLMVTNGAIFSSRKEMFLKSQMIFAGRGITATPYNDRWRKHRRLATTVLSARAVEGYTHVLDYEATILIKELIEYGKAGTLPVNPQPHAGRCSLNNMLTVVFGMRTDSINHPLVAKALRISREFMNCTGPVSNLTDFVPLLQTFSTLNYMIRRGKALHQDLVDTYGGMVKEIEARMKSGEKVPDCLVKTLVEEKSAEELDDLDMAILCSAFMIGGVETTASIMQWFSALIPAHPDIQQKAQDELDRVEVERCHNPFWLGTPHVNTQDFTYRGQFIPKDTVLVLNTYTMHHDPQRHPEPYRFNPDRYISDSTLSSESANLANPMERDHWMFGVGRRICPGMWVAEREVFLVIARLLWAFKMEQIPGEPIDLEEYDGLSGRSPVPFRIKMIPRHEKVIEVLNHV